MRAHLKCHEGVTGSASNRASDSVEVVRDITPRCGNPTRITIKTGEADLRWIAGEGVIDIYAHGGDGYFTGHSAEKLGGIIPRHGAHETRTNVTGDRLDPSLRIVDGVEAPSYCFVF